MDRASPTKAPRCWRRGAVGVVLVAAAITVASCTSTTTAAPPLRPAGSSTSTTTTGPACPLTGTPSPTGAVPQRPALAVKVDNYPMARPQSGLPKADIVFEEPVEGLITRYVAVFQCHQAALVGPVRSARAIDVGILSQFGHPLLVHVGGINPVIALINQSALINLDLGDYGSVIQHVSGRHAPYDTYASTAALWGLRPNDTTPPAPLFTYAKAVPQGSPGTSLQIPFSSESNVVWRYDAKTRTYLRFYGTTADLAASGVQESADNVVVQTVHITYGPWVENSEGGLEVQANLVGSGPLAVFRDGVEVTGTWQRSSLSASTRLLDSAGAPIPLQPGNTWVELVPSITHWHTGAPQGAASSG